MMDSALVEVGRSRLDSSLAVYLLLKSLNTSYLFSVRSNDPRCPQLE